MISDSTSLSDASLTEKTTLNGDAGKLQPVDMVFIGSQKGQLELRFSYALTYVDFSVFGTFHLAAMDTNYDQIHKVPSYPVTCNSRLSYQCTTAHLQISHFTLW
jgi:hypothetical protein